MLKDIYLRKENSQPNIYQIWWPIFITSSSYIVISGQNLTGPVCSDTDLFTPDFAFKIFSLQPGSFKLVRGGMSLDEAEQRMLDPSGLTNTWFNTGNASRHFESIEFKDGQLGPRKLAYMSVNELTLSQTNILSIEPGFNPVSADFSRKIYGEKSVLWS